jgi:hypothetical protein
MVLKFELKPVKYLWSPARLDKSKPKTSESWRLTTTRSVVEMVDYLSREEKIEVYKRIPRDSLNERLRRVRGDTEKIRKLLTYLRESDRLG